MKISKRTQDIMKIYGKINDNLMLSSGKVLRQKPHGNDMRILGFAKIEEEFPNFFIWNIHEFLGLLTALGGVNAELEFNEEYVLIKSPNGKSESKFYATAPDLEDETLRGFREKGRDTINLITTDQSRKVDFALSAEDIDDILKASSHISHHQSFSFYADGQNLKLSLGRKSPDGEGVKNVYDIELGQTNENFRFDLGIDTLKTLEGDWNGGIHFTPALSQADGTVSEPLGTIMVSTADNAMKYFFSIDTTSLFPAS